MFALALFISLLGAVWGDKDVGFLRRALDDPVLAGAMSRTMALFAVSAFLQVAIAIGWTIVIRRLGNVIKILLLLPYALGVIAPALALYALLSSILGPFDANILGTPAGAFASIVIIDVWQWVGIVLLACTLRTERIPNAAFEQATLQGLGRIEQWRLLVLPKLIPVVLLFLCVRFIDWLRKLDSIRAMFGEGGPGSAVETLGIYLYRSYFQSANQDYSIFLLLMQIVLLGVLFTVAMAIFDQVARRAGT
mgnify:FL=1